MNDQHLFGTEDDRDAFVELAGERAEIERTTKDAVTPTVIFSMIVCPSVAGLSIAYSC